MMNLLLENTRSPLHMLGDVRALLGTLRAGEDRVRALMDRYGTEAVQGRGALRARPLGAAHAPGAARRARRRLLRRDHARRRRHLSTDPMKSGPGPDPRRRRPRSTSPAPTRSRSARSAPGWQEAARSIVGPKVVLDPRHPMNAGAMRPFQVLMPPARWSSACRPRARATTSSSAPRSRG